MSFVTIKANGENCTEPLLRKEEEEKTSFAKLLLYGSIVLSPAMLGGMATSYSAVALPQMNLNINDASWFGAILDFGSPIGSILTGLIVDKFGRRPSIMISIIPNVLGWLLLILDFERTITFTGRILTGVNSGCIYISQAYASECIIVNHPNWRNSFNVWQGISYSFGMILTYLLSCFLYRQSVAAVVAAFSIIFLLINYLYVPESPKWLYHKGLVKEAKRSEKLLGIHQPILKDIDSVEAPSCSSEISDFSAVIRKLTRKDVYKPLLVITILYIMIMFSGSTAIDAYMVEIISVRSGNSRSTDIFADVLQPSNEPSYELGLISSILALVAIFSTSIVMPHSGIKKLYYFSCVGASVWLCLLGVSFFHFDNESAQYFFNTLHVLSVWCVTFFFSFGVIIIPMSILGELFPHDAKGFACIPAIALSTCSGLTVKFHPYLFLYFGGILYFFYAFILLLSMIVFGLFLPETVGKTLDEIGDFFSA